MDVFDKNLTLIDSDTKWSFNLLQEKLERKLNCLAFVTVKRMFSYNQIYFKYNKIEFYKLRNFETFIYLIKKGIIKITFRIGIYKNETKFGQIYDHGCGFSIKADYLEKLFQKVRI